MSWIKTGVVTVNGTSSASIDNCFSATYSHYMIIGITNQRGGPSSSEHRMRLRTGGSDDTSSSYAWQRIIGTTSLVGTRVTSADRFGALSLGGAYEGDHSLAYVSHPFEARPTKILFRPTLDAGGSSIESWHLAAQHSASTSFDGFTVLSDADVIYGTYYIYGLRES